MTVRFAYWMLVLALIATPLAAQEIYRVVDEQGNVTYTDQKPEDGGETVDLPELNVLGDDDDEAPLPESDSDVETEIEADASGPLDFRIVSPGDGDTLEEGNVQVEMDTNVAIPPTAQIVLFLNGQPQEPIRTLDITLDQVPPGPYQLRAELQTPEGRQLAETDSVRFEVSTAEDADGTP